MQMPLCIGSIVEAMFRAATLLLALISVILRDNQCDLFCRIEDRAKLGHRFGVGVPGVGWQDSCDEADRKSVV